MSSTPVVEIESLMTIQFEDLVQRDGGFTGMVMIPGDDSTMYMLQQSGKILIYDRNTKQLSPNPLLDLSKEIEQVYTQKPMKMDFADERGLLSLVFHPEFQNPDSLFQGVFIVMCSELADPSRYPVMYRDKFMTEIPDPDHMTCVSQYQIRSTPEETKLTRRDILCLPEPQANHNGGGLVFGPDGYLWIGLGDGGGANDEHGPLLNPNEPDSFMGNAQNLQSLHGKILRIEVVQPMNQSVPYLIPADNPLKNSPYGHSDGYPEIAHWGFRNPWRISFDGNDLYVGDVGQNRFESIKLVQGLGNNYLWRGYEGFEVFNQIVADAIRASAQQEIFPIIAYPREMGVAVVGVIMYQGSKFPDLVGKLVIADYTGRLMVGFEYQGKWMLSTLLEMPNQIYSLSQDNQGEIYILHYDPENSQGYLAELTSGTSIDSMRSPETLIPEMENEITQDGLTQEDIDQIVQQCINRAQQVKSALRTQNGQPTSTQMHVAIIKRGEDEAKLYHSMKDAWEGSKDIAKRKSYAAHAFSSNQNALTTRTIRALSQPKHIRGNINSRGQVELTIDDIPLYQLGNSNPQGGIIEFPGGLPIYKRGYLVGGLGVSGDGPPQDEDVARAGVQGFEAPESIRADPYLGEPVELLGSNSNHSEETIKIIGRKDWEKFKQNPVSGKIKLLISGNRQIRNLSEFLPWASQFVTMNFFHTRLCDLTGIDEFYNLKSLNVSRTEITDKDLVHLTDLTQLNRLELNGNMITDLRALLKLNLRFLGLACLKIKNLNGIQQMSNLEILDLYENPQLEDARVLDHLPNLKDVDIRDTLIPPQALSHISNLIC